jgi:hypothetical protein
VVKNLDFGEQQLEGRKGSLNHSKETTTKQQLIPTYLKLNMGTGKLRVNGDELGKTVRNSIT